MEPWREDKLNECVGILEQSKRNIERSQKLLIRAMICDGITVAAMILWAYIEWWL